MGHAGFCPSTVGFETRRQAKMAGASRMTFSTTEPGLQEPACSALRLEPVGLQREGYEALEAELLALQPLNL